MRMREVSRRTNLSSSSIHFYLRQGLLPPPEKLTPNSALYSEVHVQRLLLIRRLRGQGLPLAAVRRVLELVDQGVEPSVAAALQRAVVAGLAPAAMRSEESYDAAALASASGLGVELVERLVDAGVLVAPPGASFDLIDLSIARSLAEFLKRVPATVEDLAAIAGHLRDASAKEMELRNRAAQELEAPAAAALSGRLQEWANLWHAYLFSRLRQQEIAVHGLGVGEQPVGQGPDQEKS